MDEYGGEKNDQVDDNNAVLDNEHEKQEAVDRQWNVMDMSFVSEEAAFDFYNKYARDRGFSIRKDNVKRGKGISGIIRLRRFLCSRAGKRQDKFFNLEGRVRRERPESRCKCKAYMEVKLDRSRGLWVVGRFDDNHNHILAAPDEVPFLRSQRKIKDFQKSQILSMGAIGIRKYIIMRDFISKYGSFDKVGFVSKDVYNFCSREKRKLIEKGDARTALRIMMSRKEKDPDFFFDHQLDKKGRLKNLFWCDSQSRKDYQDYGDVVVFDSTYKMNRYGMPFVPFVGLNNHRRTTVFGCAIVSNEDEGTYSWVLRTFLKAMYQQRPKAVITDGDAAMIRAISNVLPDVWHRLCGWHIDQNMKRHLHHKSFKEFRSLIYYTTTEAIFEERWGAFVRKWQTPQTKEWLDRMYTKKKLWAAAYLQNGFFLGMRSNQRSETLNSCLHLHLDFGMTVVDMVVHYENAIVRIRTTEAGDNCVSSQSLPVAVTSSRAIEVSASHLFTPANFYMLQADLKKIDDLEVFDKLVGTDCEEFIVKWKNSSKYIFHVEYTPKSSEETIKCSCRRMHRKGLPCKHILHVLKVLNIREIPKCLVLRRLSKKANYGLPTKRTSDLFGWGWKGAGERTRYNDLSVLGSEAFHVACNDPILFEQLKEYMKDIISKKGGNGHSFGDEEAQMCDGIAPAIGDPIQASTKGAPKQNGKDLSNEDHRLTKNGRPLAFNERTTRTKRKLVCSACKLQGHNKLSRKCKEHPRLVC
jgi:zinc finger SWIM domain-containing protein 3